MQCNFSKAFDHASHCHLILKLNHYGIRNSILNWISAYLSSCILNDYFESTFVTKDTSSIPEFNPVTSDSLSRIELSEDSAYQKLVQLSLHKAPGSDNLYPRILKKPVQQLFLSLFTCCSNNLCTVVNYPQTVDSPCNTIFVLKRDLKLKLVIINQ